MNHNTTQGTVKDFSNQVGDSADKAVQATRKAADHALDSAQEGVDKLPSAIQESAAKVENLLRSGVDRARAATEQVKHQVVHAGECTAAYVRQEPVKAMLIATAAGAALAGLIGWMSRSRSSRY